MTRAAKTRFIIYAALAGLFIGMAVSPFRFGAQITKLERPLPHHFASSEKHGTLRFAQVHDIIHERFARRGPAYYEARNREARAALKTATPDSDKHFDLLDDLAVGLFWTGKPTEAIELMRNKLAQQQTLGKKGEELYSTYANLGTFLILQQFQEGLTKPGAKERIGESIALVKKAIEVNPDSHFGREQWQVVLEEFLVKVIDRPELLLKYDMIGDNLVRPIPGRGSHTKDLDSWGRTLRQDERTFWTKGNDPDPRIASYREFITLVGAEPDWNKDVGDISKPAPFDEPTLAIIGMWRMGAGANPYFALALGEIMFRVGQRHLAWSAYERAADTLELLWPDPDLQQKFLRHVRARQAFIEQQLPEEERGKLRPTYQANLKQGQAYQQAYQDYERQQIAKGRSVYDPHFYDDFLKSREPIATPSGDEDKFFVIRKDSLTRVPYPAMLLGAGLLAFVTALIVSFVPTKVPPTPESVVKEPLAEAKATEAPVTQHIVKETDQPLAPPAASAEAKPEGQPPPHEPGPPA